MNADLTVVFRPSVGNLVLRQVNGVGLVAKFEFFYLAVFNGQQMVDGFGKLGNDNGLVQKKRIIGKIFRFAVVYLIAAKNDGDICAIGPKHVGKLDRIAAVFCHIHKNCIIDHRRYEDRFLTAERVHIQDTGCIQAAVRFPSEKAFHLFSVRHMVITDCQVHNDTS